MEDPITECQYRPLQATVCTQTMQLQGSLALCNFSQPGMLQWLQVGRCSTLQRHSSSNRRRCHSSSNRRCCLAGCNRRSPTISQSRLPGRGSEPQGLLWLTFPTMSPTSQLSQARGGGRHKQGPSSPKLSKKDSAGLRSRCVPPDHGY